MQYNSRRIQFLCALFCLLIMLSACDTISENGAAPTPSPAKTSTQLAAAPTATTRQAEPVQTCPPAGSARAALIPPLTLRNHANALTFSLQTTSTLSPRPPP